MSRLPGQPFDDAFAEHRAEGAEVDPVKLVLNALSGRILLAAGAGAVLALCFATLGYLAGGTMITYESRGLVRIVPSRPAILYQTEVNERLPAYESFRLSQARLIQSQRLLNWAVADEQMREAGWPDGEMGLKELEESLSVDVPRNEELIVVTVRHASRDVARVAADAVLRAYERLAIDTAAQDLASREAELVRLRNRYEQERNEARDEVLRLAAQHGTDDLQRTRDSKHMELQDLDSRILDVELTLARFADAADADEEAGGGEGELDLESLPMERLAASNPAMGSLLERHRELRLGLSTLLERYTEEHPQVRRMRQSMNAIERELEAEATRTRRAMAGVDGEEGFSPLSGVRQLNRELERLRSLREELAAEVRSLGRTQLQIDHQTQRAAESSAQLAETTQRLEELRVEAKDSRVARAEVVQRAERALRPASDRRNQFAAAGFIGGAGLGVGLVALPGILRPRFRMVRHVTAKGSEFKLIGIVPELATKTPAGDALVHTNLRHIANQLEAELLREPGGRVVYGVTSAVAGEGKTSLTIALASVLARDGRRVLTIDADMTGRALSAQFELSDRPGLQQLAEGGVRFEPAFVRDARGFGVIPAGHREGSNGRAITPKDVVQTLDAYAGSFDIVLIDTGPILGCAEAAAVALAVERTLLVVSRGQDESLVRAARDRLNQLGVSRLGVVFNRASRADVERDSSSVSASRASVSGGRLQRLGLARAAGVAQDEGHGTGRNGSSGDAA